MSRRTTSRQLEVVFSPMAGPSASVRDVLPVDFILVYKKSDEVHEDRREAFEDSLREVGLELKTEFHDDFGYVKVSVPQKVLYQYGELLRMRMPINLDRSISPKTISDLKIGMMLSFLSVAKIDQKKYTLMTEFDREKIHLFDKHDPQFFNTRARIFVAAYLIERGSFGDDTKTGIHPLILDDVYKMAYPLHEGNLEDPYSQRCILHDEWASIRQVLQPQPIDEILNYFGPTIALYFTWEGFYIGMLIPSAIVGALCFCGSWAFFSQKSIISEVCANNSTMCPTCDYYCPYWTLNSLCSNARWSFLVDNYLTIALSIFNTVWSTLYVAMWKRYKNIITYSWSLPNYHSTAEPTRAEYLSKMSKKKNPAQKLNVSTLIWEPHLPFWRKRFPIYCLSVTIMLLLLVFYTTIYIIQVTLESMAEMTDVFQFNDVWRNCSYFVNILVTLIKFGILYFCFRKFVVVITDMELHRTQSAHEDSLYLKYFSLECVMFYLPIIHTAFFRGKFIGRPGSYNRVFGFRGRECKLDGCQLEITLLLVVCIIMKQIVYICSIVIWPMFRYHKQDIINWLRRRKKVPVDEDVPSNQMLDDQKLLQSKYTFVKYGYMQMAMEFGFITLFGVSSPLVPLLVLVCNIVRIRVEAHMCLKYYRRPVPRLVRNIGIWMQVIIFICRVSVVTNSFINAMSPRFLPQIVFYYEGLSRSDGAGMLANTLSLFDTADFEEGSKPRAGLPQSDSCYYFDYRFPPSDKRKYKRTFIFWQILTVRLAFVIVYHIVVYTIIAVLQMLIPTMPAKISDKIQMEAYHINKAILKPEKRKD